MIAIYLCSLQPGAGKTALAAGLARWLHERSLGYLALASQPGSPTGSSPVESAGADARLLAQATGIETGPVVAANGDLRQAYQTLAQGKDVLLLEGRDDLGETAGVEACLHTLEATGAQAIVLARYAPGFSTRPLLAAAQRLGSSLTGVIINAIPEPKWSWAVDTLRPELEQAGVPILGLLPEVWGLYGASVGQIAQHLGGELLTCPEAAEDLVENLMVGPMAVDPLPHHLGRKANKALITRANRVDIQLGALATSTACYILCGPDYPTADILNETQSRGIPIIRVDKGIIPTLDLLEGLFSQVRFHQVKKLPPWEALLEQHFDFAALHSRLGLDA